MALYGTLAGKEACSFCASSAASCSCGANNQGTESCQKLCTLSCRTKFVSEEDAGLACQILFASEDALPSFVADTVRYKGTIICMQSTASMAQAGQYDRF